MSEVSIPSSLATGSGEPTIEQRVDDGRATQSPAHGNIVPLPEGVSFRKVPVPDGARGNAVGVLQKLIAAGYRESGRWVYRWKTGEELFAIARYDKDGEGKQVRPIHYLGSNVGPKPYTLAGLEKPRPLYNLDLVYGRADAPVLFVEGEKAAEAASARFPDYVATTWPGGTGGVSSADLRDVAGRRAVLWPDNDKPGKDAMATLAARLATLGCDVALVNVPPSYPEKWDLADDYLAGLPEHEQPAALLAAAVTYKPLAPQPKSGKSVPTTKTGGDMDRFFDAVRHLGASGVRDYAGHDDWFALMCATKHGYGEPAFDRFVAISREYGGTDTDDHYRHRWDSIGEAESQITPRSFFAQARESGWKDEGDGEAGGRGGRGGGKPDPAAVVLEQSAEAGDVLWMDQHGKAHVSMLLGNDDEPKRTVHARVGGKRHKGIVSDRYVSALVTRVLSGEQERRAMQLFEHRAREGGNVFASYNRAAADGYSIYVDLGTADGAAVHVTASGWQVVADVPVRFVRGSRGELPVPERGGALQDFRRHFNVLDRDLLRLLAFVAGTLAPLPSFPILLIDGGQGTAKSTIGDMVLALCDPPTTTKGGRFTLPKGDQNLIVHALGLRVMFADNLSDITQAEADMLCRLVTGGGSSTRQHYSDEDEVQLTAVRPVIVTAIGSPSARGDFLDRCVRVTAQPIALRRTEEQVMKAFEADRPKLLGFVMDMLVCALRNKASVEAKAASGNLRLTRMADFALYAEAAAEALGLEVGAFSADLLEEQATMQAEAAIGEPLGEALFRYFSVVPRREVLEAHATEFLEELQGMVADQKRLPAGNKLKGVLKRIEPGLRDLGMVLEIREPARGSKNRKAIYRVAATHDFVPKQTKEPF